MKHARPLNTGQRFVNCDCFTCPWFLPLSNVPTLFPRGPRGYCSLLLAAALATSPPAFVSRAKSQVARFIGGEQCPLLLHLLCETNAKKTLRHPYALSVWETAECPVLRDSLTPGCREEALSSNTRVLTDFWRTRKTTLVPIYCACCGKAPMRDPLLGPPRRFASIFIVSR